MTYTVGGLIEAADYNGFASSGGSNVNGIWGTGAASYGYGQSTTLSTVSANAVISATQWASLVNLLSNIGAHQGTTITSRTAPVTGDTISILANVAADITTLTTNRGNAAASGTDITTNGTTSTTTPWAASATTTQTVTFADANSARYFFNGGGMIRINWNLANGTYTNSTEWSDLFTKSGTIAFTGGVANQTIAGTTYTGTTKIGGSGVVDTLASTTGYYDLTPGAAATTLFKQFADTAPYTGHYVQLSAALAANSSQLTFTTTCIDAGGNQGVDGNLIQTMVVRPPSTTYLTNTWGTPAMSAATWTTANGNAATFVAVANNRVTGSQTVTVNKPTGTTTGDLMIACACTDNTGTEKTWDTPAGWTELYDEATVTLNGPDLAVWYKIANASEPANYTFSMTTGTDSLTAAIATYRGAAYAGYLWTVNPPVFSTPSTYYGQTLVPNSTVVFVGGSTSNNRTFSITGYGNILVFTANSPSLMIMDQTYANIVSEQGNIGVSSNTNVKGAAMVVLMPAE